MAKAIKRQRIETQAMVPHFSGAAMNVTYHETTYNAHAWECSGCGLLWERKWHAETCEKRGHIAAFEQHYGGYVENGVHKGGATYMRQAIGKTPHSGIPQAAKEETRHLCQCGSGLPKYDLTDARGIFCCYVCDHCESQKRNTYRPDIFTDPNYWHDEPI